MKMKLLTDSNYTKEEEVLLLPHIWTDQRCRD